MSIKIPKGTLSIWPGSSGALASVPGDHALDLWSPSARRDQRARKRRSQYFCRIDVYAAVSVFVVLLFIIMLSTPTSHRHSGVDLPRTKYPSWLPGAIREDAMRLTLTRDGKIYFGYRVTSQADLPAQIRTALHAGAEKRIYVLADARARYRDVKIALDGIRLAGVPRVTFITEARPLPPSH